jgi:hypothetical protein
MTPKGDMRGGIEGALTGHEKVGRIESAEQTGLRAHMG